MAFGAGADLMTVLGAAGDSTVAGAVKAAKKHGKGVVADIIGVKNKPERLKELAVLGVTLVELHAGLDEQAETGYSIDSLLAAGRGASIPFSIAGGINVDRIGQVEKAGAAIAVAGAAIYGASDPAAAAKALRDKIQQHG